MNTELATLPSNVVAKEHGNLALTALMPQDMQQCQQNLIHWCKRKIAELKTDHIELATATKHAKDQKWKSTTLERHTKIAKKRVEFYEKMKAALEAGFCIVPNFPVQMFLIRTNRTSPLRMVTDSDWQQDLKQSSELLALGDGAYANPFPLIEKHKVAVPSESRPERTTTRHSATGWDDIEFPVTMAKPQIMEAVTHAMALNIFDQFGVLPHMKKEDPIIVGQLIDPRDKWQTRVVSFMVAWHLDTRTL